MRPVILFAAAGVEVETCAEHYYDDPESTTPCICKGDNVGLGYDGALHQNLLDWETILKHFFEWHPDTKPRQCWLQLPNNVHLMVLQA